MDIGKELGVEIVTPLEAPQPQRKEQPALPQPQPEKQPAKETEKVD